MMNLPNLESINRLWLDMTDVSDKTPLHILQKPCRYTSNPIICTSRPLCTAATPCPSCTQNYTTAFPAPSTPRWWGTGPGRPGRTEPLPQGEQTYEFRKLNFLHTKRVYLLIFCNESTYLETGRSFHFCLHVWSPKQILDPFQLHGFELSWHILHRLRTLISSKTQWLIYES